MWMQVKDTSVIGHLDGGMSYALLSARHRAVKYHAGFQQITLIFPSTGSPIVPSRYLYPTAETVSVNVSSQDGRCSSVSRSNDCHSRCEDPTSSVLFDGNIPTLTGIDGDMWASQLLTLQIRNPSGIEIISDFVGRTGVGRVELVMFNCPESGINC